MLQQIVCDQSKKEGTGKREGLSGDADSLLFFVAEKAMLRESLDSFRVSMLTVDRDLGSFLGKGNEECCVCRQEYRFGQRISFMECFHQFQAACLAKWLEKKSAERRCSICLEPMLGKGAEKSEEED